MIKHWKFLLPDWSQLDTLWLNPKPFALWPVGDKPFIAHWMDRAIEEDIQSVAFYTADRPTELRAYLQEGGCWSRIVSVVAIQSDEKAPDDAIPLLGLPRANRISAPLGKDGGLLRHWLQVNRDWLDTVHPYALRVERKHGDRGWISPKAKVHPSAKLVPPFWIQENCEIGAGAQIGPYACIAENCIIDDNAIVRDSVVLPGTLVGQNTELDRVAVDGGILLDSKHACRVAIADSFVLSQLEPSRSPTPWTERAGALLLFLLAWPCAKILGRSTAVQEFHDGSGGVLALRTAQSGSLFLRRHAWLKEVFKGRMRLIGILPRPIDWAMDGLDEVQQRLKEIKPGVFALSDVHGCHHPDDPDEWTHAAYQALETAPGVRKIVRANLWRIALSRQASTHA